jgi:hypothetical protein
MKGPFDGRRRANRLFWLALSVCSAAGAQIAAPVAAAPTPTSGTTTRHEGGAGAMRHEGGAGAMRHEGGAGPNHSNAAGHAGILSRLSKLERRKIELVAHGTPEIEPEPEGKIIERVNVVRLDVLDDEDPLPAWEVLGSVVNSLHTRSQKGIIARDILVHEGKPYVQADADETERNLRRLQSQLSFAVALPLKSSRPGYVRVLVLTKDVWSLRLGWTLDASAAGIDSLVLNPVETNVWGLHHVASMTFQYLPESFSLGASYSVPRFGKSFIGARGNAGLFWNARSGDTEGSTGGLSVGQPLYTTRTAWAWNVSGSWSDRVARRYSNARLLRFGPRDIPTEGRVPFEYRASTTSVGAGFTRSFGWLTKHDLSLDAGITMRNNRTFDLSPYDRRAVDAFLNVVPTNDTRVGPTITYHAYTTKFHRITDFETLALQEDYRLGHDVYLRGYPVLDSIGSSRTFLGLYGSAQYTVPLGNGIARASVEGMIEADDKRVYDASIEGHLRVVSPKTFAGRFIADLAGYSRPENYMKTSVGVGGETRLRGFPTGAFIGKDFVLYSLEFRTRPLQLWSVALGGAVFYDVGDVFSGFENFRPKQSTGVGFRLLIPQFNRVVLRGDLSFPLSRPLPAAAPPVAFFFGFDQAFGFGTAAP